MRDGEAQELAGLPKLSGASPMLRAAEGRWAQLAQGSQTRRCGVAVLKAEAAAAAAAGPVDEEAAAAERERQAEESRVEAARLEAERVKLAREQRLLRFGPNPSPSPGPNPDPDN